MSITELKYPAYFEAVFEDTITCIVKLKSSSKGVEINLSRKEVSIINTFHISSYFMSDSGYQLKLIDESVYKSTLDYFTDELNLI